MLIVDCPARDIKGLEYFDNRTQEFVTVEPRHIDPIHLQLEHSLMSIAKWEAKWHEPFLGKDNLTGEELLDYVRCMTINQQKNPDTYQDLTQEALLEIVEYMQDESSAWKISPKKKGKKQKKPDSVEAIYYAMIQYGIPFEPCEKWHIGSLMALIDYCAKNGAAGQKEKPKNMRELRESWYRINEANRKKYNSRG